MGTLTSLTTCFLALRPDDAFSARVLSYKQRTKQRIGPQLYLDDPPHLTLYLASFPHVASLVAAASEIARRMRMPIARVGGWHVFRDDPLNGNHTLVCDIAPDQRHDLAVCQQRVCAAVSSLRDRDGSAARYAPFWPKLSEPARANVAQRGFPFVGAIWHPHVSIASIRPVHWDALWSELENDPPSGIVRFPELCLYALKNGRPVLLERFALESLP
jgi:2'-5' RNA ligase